MTTLRRFLTEPLTESTKKRLQLSAVLLPVAMWLVYSWTALAIDLSSSGRIDRSGHIKGHDFVHFYVLGQIGLERATSELYDLEAQGRRIDRLIPQYESRFVPIHPPMVAMFMAPFAALPYIAALTLAGLLSLVLYAGCCSLLLTACGVRANSLLPLLLCAAFPPFYFLFLYGQTSAIALACVTAAFLALRSGRRWSAGFALGLLAYKPSLGFALPFVLFYGREWKMIGGAAIAIGLQFIVAVAYFGGDALVDCVRAAINLSTLADMLEPNRDMMHSLRAFFYVLLPWTTVALVCYLAAAAAVIAAAARCWRRSGPLELRFAVLLLATVLVDPHVYPYELMVIAPVFIWIGATRQRWTKYGWPFGAILYGGYFAPLLAFATRVTHVQVSVLVLVAMMVIVARESRAIGFGPAAGAA